jgi:hypothetical protein
MRDSAAAHRLLIAAVQAGRFCTCLAAAAAVVSRAHLLRVAACMSLIRHCVVGCVCMSKHAHQQECTLLFKRDIAEGFSVSGIR